MEPVLLYIFAVVLRMLVLPFFVASFAFSASRSYTFFLLARGRIIAFLAISPCCRAIATLFHHHHPTPRLCTPNPVSHSRLKKKKNFNRTTRKVPRPPSDRRECIRQSFYVQAGDIAVHLFVMILLLVTFYASKIVLHRYPDFASPSS